MSVKFKSMKEAVDKIKNRCPEEIEYLKEFYETRRERLMADMVKFSDPTEIQHQAAKISALTEILVFLR